MKQRCLNKNSAAYNHYGKRGIKVCEEWKNSYECFRDWALKNGYRGHLTIERVNVNEGYYPGNCKWITKIEQLKNKQNSVIFKGETARAASLRLGKTESLIHMRLKSGWSKERAFTTPVDTSTEYKGESATAASKRLGGSRGLVCMRLRQGWPKERAFTEKI